MTHAKDQAVPPKPYSIAHTLPSTVPHKKSHPVYHNTILPRQLVLSLKCPAKYCSEASKLWSWVHKWVRV